MGSYNVEVAVLGWWVPGDKIQKNGKPNFIKSVVRKMIIETQAKSSLIPSRMQITQVRRQPKLKDGTAYPVITYSVKGWEEKPVRFEDRRRGTAAPLQEVKVNTFTTEMALINWLARLLKGGESEATRSVIEMITAEPVMQNGKDADMVEAA